MRRRDTDEAPSYWDDILSQASLDLSPAVAAVAEECRARHYEKLRREPESSTQSRVARRRRLEQAAG